MGWLGDILKEFMEFQLGPRPAPLNLLIVWLFFSHSYLIMRFLKEGGSKAIGKVFALLLAAFAMTMIRTEIMEWMK